MPFFEVMLVFVAVLGNISLGLFTLLRNPKSATSRLFFVFSLTMALYLVANFMIRLQTSNEMAFLWIRAVMSLAVFINLFFFLLVYTFPKRKSQLPKRRVLLLILISFTLLFVTSSNLIFSEVSIAEGKILSEPGLGMPFFLLHTIFFLGGGFILLVKKYRNSRGLEKIQTLFFLLGTVFMFFAILITNLLFVIVFNASQFIGLLPLYTLVFFSLISYAIIKHQFLDVRLIVARSVAYLLTILGLGIIYVFGAYQIQSLISGQRVPLPELLPSALLALLLIFTYQPLLRLLQPLIEKFFFRSSYNASEVLEKVGKATSSSIEFSPLLNSVTQIIVEKLKSQSVSVLLTEKEMSGLFKQVKYSLTPQAVHELKPIFKQAFSVSRKPVIYEETDNGSMREIMRKHQIAVVFPLEVNQELIGVLLISQKETGSIYAVNDLDVLNIIAPQLAIGIQNALSFEEVRLFKQTVDAATDGIEITDVQRKLIYVNEAWEKLTGFDEKEVIGKASNLLKSDLTDPKIYLEMERSLAQSKPYTTEDIVYQRRDGTTYPAQLSVFPVQDHGVTQFFVEIHQDITRRHELDRAKTDFISIASHQLNTPLSAMKWFLQMLLEGKAGNLTAKQKDMVQNAYDSNDRMTSLVRSLLNVSRVESGRILIHPEKISLVELIEDVIKEMKPVFAHNHQKIVFKHPEQVPKISLDPALMRHVFSNLLSNSNKYSPDKETITVKLSMKSDPDLVVVSVTDQGYGIPKKDLENIFEKFFRGDNVRKLQVDGSGLGLYLVKSIVDSSGGEIALESEENKGTTITVTFPLSGSPSKKGEVSLVQ